jgi:hypothetical protein
MFSRKNLCPFLSNICLRFLTCSNDNLWDCKLTMWGLYFVYYQVLVKCISFQHVALATLIQFYVQFFLSKKIHEKSMSFVQTHVTKTSWLLFFKSCDLSKMIEPTFPMFDVSEQNSIMLVESTLVEFVKWNKSTKGIGSLKMLK